MKEELIYLEGTVLEQACGQEQEMFGWSKSCHHRRKKGEKQSMALSKGGRKSRDHSAGELP